MTDPIASPRRMTTYPIYLEAKFGDDFYLRLKETPASLDLLLEFTKMVQKTLPLITEKNQSETGNQSLP